PREIRFAGGAAGPAPGFRQPRLSHRHDVWQTYCVQAGNGRRGRHRDGRPPPDRAAFRRDSQGPVPTRQLAFMMTLNAPAKATSEAATRVARDQVALKVQRRKYATNAVDELELRRRIGSDHPWS